MAYNNAYTYQPQPPPHESHHSAFTIEASGRQDGGDSDDDPNEDKDGTMQHNNDEDYSLSSCTNNTGTKDFNQQDARIKDSYHQGAEPDPTHYISKNSNGKFTRPEDRKKKSATTTLFPRPAAVTSFHELRRQHR
ncbi:hypothetical protein EDD21DRAFT_351928 [Dissophora ornata]|nr:hypothetical protein EDD21DRAFT_351928 [Dissophora ornata]